MNNFWKNLNVLITGGSGFIGRNLINRLAEKEANITNLSQKVSSTDIIHSKLNTVNSTILNYDELKELINKHKIEFIFHLAAQPLVESAEENPLLSFETNIKGTWNILEAGRQCKVNGIILASTSHVYGDNQLPYLEEYFPRPTRPYETSKACADMLAQTYSSFYNMPIAIARFANIYGPGDKNKRIVPNTIELLLKYEPPQIYDDETSRDYLYIDDAIDAYILLAENLSELKKKNENVVFNFGTGKHYTNEFVVKKIMDIMSKGKIRPAIIKSARKQEIKNQYVSIEKAKKLLGWKPKSNIDKGLRETIKQYTTVL